MIHYTLHIQLGMALVVTEPQSLPSIRCGSCVEFFYAVRIPKVAESDYPIARRAMLR